MIPFKCFCLLCVRAFEMLMTPMEFKMLVCLVKDSLMPDGRLGLACDACVPFKFSVGGGKC